MCPLMGHKRLKLSDQIRQAVDSSGMTRYAICKQIGMDQGTMSRFMSAKTALSLENVDRIGDCLGLTIVASGQRKAKSKGR